MMARRVMAGRGGFNPKALFANNEQGVWYDPSDFSTLFQDAEGTTPVTAIEQPVGLLLDKSKGFVYGNELVTNGTFDAGISGWALGSEKNAGTIGWNGAGAAVITCSAATPRYVALRIPTFLPLVAGKKYLVTATVTSMSCQYIAVGMSSSIMVENSDFGNSGNKTTPQTMAFISSPTLNQGIIYVTAYGTTGQTAVFDNISVREISANYAYQTANANRPTLSARVNLLTKTEQFDDAAWNKASVAVTANQAIAPDGTTTADKLVASAVNSAHYLYQYLAGSNPSLTYAIYAKKAEYNYVYLKTQPDGSTLNYGIVVDLTTGSVTKTRNNATGYTVSSSVSDAGNGWRRVVINVAPVTYMYFSVVGISTSTITYSSYSDAIYTGDGTSGIYIWGADLRPANLGSNVPVYQRVNTSTDYDTVGFPLYLAFNGISSSMATGGIDFSATDKMSVFAGVRKLSDATNARIIAELSATTESNNGSFSLQGPNVAGAATYLWQSKGTALTDAQATGRTAPITNILTGIGDIAGDSAILRVNGVQADSDTGDQGTGNYGNYPLYIGARGGSSLYFNGHLYSLIVRGAQSSANLITAAERYVARKTGVTL